MGRLSEDRREVEPPRPRRRFRQGATLGSRTNISVPISFGLPLIAIGLALVAAAARTGAAVFWVAGLFGLALGVGLFASGRRL